MIPSLPLPFVLGLVALLAGCDRLVEDGGPTGIRVIRVLEHEGCAAEPDAPALEDATFDVAIGESYQVSVLVDSNLEARIERATVGFTRLGPIQTSPLPGSPVMLDQLLTNSPSIVSVPLIPPALARELANLPDFVTQEDDALPLRGRVSLVASVELEGVTAEREPFRAYFELLLNVCAGCQSAEGDEAECAKTAEPVECPSRIGAEDQTLSCAQCRVHARSSVFAELCGDAEDGPQ